MRGNNPELNDSAPGGNGVSVTVIVPVYNDEAGLTRCLRALEKQTLRQSLFEIIVVDNGSDIPPRIQAPANSRVLTETMPGSYAARNAGLMDATASIIAFTDADCIPEPDWLVEGLTYLDAHPDLSSVGGRIEVFPYNAEHRTPIELYELMKAFPQGKFVANHGYAATANLFVRNTVFEAVGPFNSALRSGGDLEFGNRSTNAGFRMEYTSSAVVRHPARRTMSAALRKMFRTMAGIRDLALLRGQPFPYQVSGTVRGLVPPVPSVVQALGNHDVGPPIDRLKYAWAILVVHYARAAFRFALLLGARSPR